MMYLTMGAFIVAWILFSLWLHDKDCQENKVSYLILSIFFVILGVYQMTKL